MSDAETFYDEIGGSPTIRGIVKRFYEGVATDEVLRPLYPEEDLGPAEDRFAMFLEQYWGGPTTYSEPPRAPPAADAARAVRGHADGTRPLAAPTSAPRSTRPT